MNPNQPDPKPATSIADETMPGPSESDLATFDRLVERLARDGVIRSGPFEGMRFDADASWGGVAPYLVGSYEYELQDAIERLIVKDYTQVIDVGCAEGYYAVGLALRLPRAEVVAFDIDPQARSACQSVAAVNAVDDRVHIRGACDPEELARLVQPGSLVIVDCEGYELELLQPDLVPGLREVDLIVEMHDFIDPMISTQITERFSPSHHIELIDAAPRDPQQFAALREQPGWVQFLASYEGRPTEPHAMQWAIMEPRSS